MPRTFSDRIRQLVTVVVERGRGVLAFGLVLHGAAHLVGTRGAMQAVDAEPLEYLFGSWTIGSPWLLYLFAALWTIVSAGFALAGWLVYMEAVNWQRVTWSLALASLVLSIIGLPMAWFGVVVNVALLGLSWSPAVAEQFRHPAAHLT
jgi:hypothetical protein